VEIRGLTIADGAGFSVISCYGGDLTLINSTVRNNQGGGIYGFGAVNITIDNSTFKDNGFGVSVLAGELRITNSTFSGNQGSAIKVDEATATIVNSTLSGNTADRGAGIWSYAGVAIINSTIMANSATTGGGIYIVDQGPYGSGTVNLTNSIVAHNKGGDCGGTLASNLPTDGGYNVDSDGSCGLDSAKGSLPATDPLLGPLAANGGPTKTHALRSNSPAIDAVPLDAKGQCVVALGSQPDPLKIDTDQRGVARPQDGNGDGQARCDIGAFEFQGTQCDVNGNGRFDRRDVVQFYRACHVGKAYRQCDYDNNGRFNLHDVILFVKQCRLTTDKDAERLVRQIVR
jgi:hypothetical protein